MDRESALEAIYEDDGDYPSDVDMVDASEEGEIKEYVSSGLENPRFSVGISIEPSVPGCLASDNDLDKVINKSKHVSQRKHPKKKRRNHDNSIGYINRFVISTCRQLREPKSFLVWEAISKLGITAVKQYVEEVFTIENQGGQMTADGKRHRTPGGILWNIMKSREPEVFKEIMQKGKEFEKQLRKDNGKSRTIEMSEQANNKRSKIDSGDSGRNNVDHTDTATSRNLSEPSKDKPFKISLQESSLQDSMVKAWADGVKKTNAVSQNGYVVENTEKLRPSGKVKLPVRDRIRVPVVYDDPIVEDTADND